MTRGLSGFSTHFSHVIDQSVFQVPPGFNLQDSNVYVGLSTCLRWSLYRVLFGGVVRSRRSTLRCTNAVDVVVTSKSELVPSGSSRCWVGLKPGVETGSDSETEETRSQKGNHFINYYYPRSQQRYLSHCIFRGSGYWPCFVRRLRPPKNNVESVTRFLERVWKRIRGLVRGFLSW